MKKKIKFSDSASEEEEVARKKFQKIHPCGKTRNFNSAFGETNLQARKMIKTGEDHVCIII
jgi:hypothetical protein